MDIITGDYDARLEAAIKKTAPGTALRTALDMIIGGNLGALICVGDSENVIAAGGDGFPLDVSFTANRLFELCKMDGAVVLDGGLNKILRANYHLNPNPTVPTSETGTRHRTAARMSLLTKAIVISVSERRSVINIFVEGKRFQLKSVQEIMSQVNQLTFALQNTRSQLDRALLRLTSLELDNFVTLADIAEVFYLFEVLISASEQLDSCILLLGSEGRITAMQRDEFVGDTDDVYTLMIRDYARDSSEENARAIRRTFHETPNATLRSPSSVARILGYDDRNEDSIMTPLGLRTLSRVSVVREGMADKIIDEYGSLQELVAAVEDDPEQLGKVGVNNPDVLANSLHRMTWGHAE